MSNIQMYREMRTYNSARRYTAVILASFQVFHMDVTSGQWNRLSTNGGEKTVHYHVLVYDI